MTSADSDLRNAIRNNKFYRSASTLYPVCRLGIMRIIRSSTLHDLEHSDSMTFCGLFWDFETRYIFLPMRQTLSDATVWFVLSSLLFI
jgi:hypothetical protein